MTSVDINIDLSKEKWLKYFRMYSMKETEHFPRIFLSLLVFGLEGAVIPPPPHTHTMVKVAETATRARAKDNTHLC